MFYTKNDLSVKTRQNAILLLQTRLADGIDLMGHAKQAHWNVKGAGFFALHKLFDKVHEEIEECCDLLAERIAQFGGSAEGTARAVSQRSSLPEYPLSIFDAHDHLEALSNSLSTFCQSIRQGIAQATEWQDMGTADIFTQISRTADKNLWFVESHFSTEKAKARGVA